MALRCSIAAMKLPRPARMRERAESVWRLVYRTKDLRKNLELIRSLAFNQHMTSRRMNLWVLASESASPQSVSSQMRMLRSSFKFVVTRSTCRSIQTSPRLRHQPCDICAITAALHMTRPQAWACQDITIATRDKCSGVAAGLMSGSQNWELLGWGTTRMGIKHRALSAQCSRR